MIPFLKKGSKGTKGSNGTLNEMITLLSSSSFEERENPQNLQNLFRKRNYRIFCFSLTVLIQKGYWGVSKFFAPLPPFLIPHYSYALIPRA